MNFLRILYFFDLYKTLGIKISYLPAAMDPSSDEYSSPALYTCTMTQEEMEELEVPSNISCESCVICISNLNLDTDRLRLLPCEHVFHENCLFNWLKMHAICPLCRHVLKDNTNIVSQDQVDGWRTFLHSPNSLSIENILPGTDFYAGPSANTRSQIERRL
ncbi:hypothetical protein ACKWTF_009712 [Chironomus riparius]